MAKKKDIMIPRNEFRYNFTHKHKTYVFGETDNNYQSVGITHSPKTFKKNNMKLNTNPQKGKIEQSYIRNGIINDKKNNYSKRTIKNLSFDKDDFSNVKSKIRHYKRKSR